MTQKHPNPSRLVFRDEGRGHAASSPVPYGTVHHQRWPTVLLRPHMPSPHIPSDAKVKPPGLNFCTRTNLSLKSSPSCAKVKPPPPHVYGMRTIYRTVPYRDAPVEREPWGVCVSDSDGGTARMRQLWSARRTPKKFRHLRWFRTGSADATAVLAVRWCRGREWTRSMYLRA